MLVLARLAPIKWSHLLPGHSHFSEVDFPQQKSRVFVRCNKCACHQRFIKSCWFWGPLSSGFFSFFSWQASFHGSVLGRQRGKKQSTSEFYSNLKVLNFLEPKHRCPNEILKMTNLLIPLNTALQNNVHAYHPIIHQYWGFPVSCVFGHIQTAMQMTRSYNFRIHQ